MKHIKQNDIITINKREIKSESHLNSFQNSFFKLRNRKWPGTLVLFSRGDRELSFFFLGVTGNSHNHTTGTEASTSNLKLSELFFSCLPLINGYSTRVEIYEEAYENIFKNYFLKAYFINKIPDITKVYRLYKYETMFEKEFEVFNYILINYDASRDLTINEDRCISECEDSSGIITSKCFNSKLFQLVIALGESPGASFRFYLNVSYEIFCSFLQSSHEEEYGYDDDYQIENRSFEISVFAKFQRNTILASLKEQSFLTTLIALYKFEFTYDHIVYANLVTSFYNPKFYEGLSLYIF